MTNREKITWDFLKKRLQANNSSTKDPYAKKYVTHIETLIEHYDGDSTKKDLFVNYLRKCKECDWVFTMPEVWPKSYLFIGEGTPRDSSHPFDLYVAFVPLEAENNYNGKQFRDCVKEALPERARASYVNAYSCGSDEDLSVRFLKDFICRWEWNRIVAVGGVAKKMMKKHFGNTRFKEISHPHYALQMRPHTYGKTKYINDIKHAIE